MKIFKYIILSQDLIEQILTYFPKKKFKTLSPLFYEGQIPIAGYLILQGFVQVSKKKKMKKMLESGTLIAVSELVNKTPISISAEAFPDSEICYIDKSTLLEIHQGSNSQLSAALKSAMEN